MVTGSWDHPITGGVPYGSTVLALLNSMRVSEQSNNRIKLKLRITPLTVEGSSSQSPPREVVDLAPGPRYLDWKREHLLEPRGSHTSIGIRVDSGPEKRQKQTFLPQ